MADRERDYPEVPDDIPDYAGMYRTEIVDDFELGRCLACGHTEERPAEELEPGSECPNCHKEKFGAVLEGEVEGEIE